MAWERWGILLAIVHLKFCVVRGNCLIESLLEVFSDWRLPDADDDRIAAALTFPKVAAPKFIWLPFLRFCSPFRGARIGRHSFDEIESVLLWPIEALAICADRFHLHPPHRRSRLLTRGKAGGLIRARPCSGE